MPGFFPKNLFLDLLVMPSLFEFFIVSGSIRYKDGRCCCTVDVVFQTPQENVNAQLREGPHTPSLRDTQPKCVILNLLCARLHRIYLILKASQLAICRLGRSLGLIANDFKEIATTISLHHRSRYRRVTFLLHTVTHRKETFCFLELLKE